MSGINTTPYLLRNAKRPPVCVAPELPQPPVKRLPVGVAPKPSQLTPKTRESRKVYNADRMPGKKRKKEDQDTDKSDVREDKEDKEEDMDDKEDEDSVNGYGGKKAVLSKGYVTAEELECEMKKVLCHAFEICMLWMSYIRSRGELMELGESRNPENKAALGTDLLALRRKYSKRQKTSDMSLSADQISWIEVLKCLMMVRVQDYQVPFRPHVVGKERPNVFGRVRNYVVERAREIYKNSSGLTSISLSRVCPKVTDRLNQWESLPPEDMVGYNNWFKLQPKYEGWEDYDYNDYLTKEKEDHQKHVVGWKDYNYKYHYSMAEDEEDKKTAVDSEDEDEDDRKPAAVEDNDDPKTSSS